MEKLLTKKDTKMVVKNLLDYLKKIIIASESIPNYEGELEDVIGDIEIDIANMVCPDKWIEVETGGKIKIKCEYMGGATKDNAFIDGTVFRGKIIEKTGVTEIKGLITTAVIFHTILIAFFVAFVAVCIARQGFSIVPICLVIFDIFMYKDEFKKQGIIERYVYRAVKISEREKQSHE